MTTASFTPENVRRALESFRDNELASPFGEFSTEIEELYNDAADEFLSGFDPSDFDGYDEDEAAEELCQNIASYLQGAQDNGAHCEWADSSLIYTSDIMEFYHDNESDCDDKLNEIDLSGCSSISEIIAYTANLVFSDMAYSEIDDAIQTVESGAGEMSGYLS